MMEIAVLDPDEIHEIQPLWESLNHLHEEKSDYYKAHFRSFTFEQRLDQFKNRNGIKVFAAKDNGTLAGYCIASQKDNTGEIDSIFILPGYRKTGLGNELMQTAEQWLENQGIDKIHICVAQGNEAVFEFYGKHGYLHRFSVLEKRVK